MPKYYGCPCEGCGEPLKLTDDIVVCPDCGAPYHRACYDKVGRCVHAPAHGAGYVWQFPYSDDKLRVCPACGERTLRSAAHCRCCGAELPPENAASAKQEPHAAGSASGSFDYAGLYRQFESGNVEDAVRQVRRAAFGRDETMDGISCKDWTTYIGPRAEHYMNTYSRMQLQHSKISMSLSALLFGSFYFFYRKAWKPAFAFMAAELLLALPVLIDMMQLTGSALAPGLSQSTLLTLAQLSSLLNFALMIVRGMFGKWLYRKSAGERIRRIQAQFPDAEQRRVVLAAQGGVSFAAVIGAFALLFLIGGASTLLLGPDLQTLVTALYG